MKINKRKWGVVVLALLLAMSIFAGCGANDQDANSQEATENAEVGTSIRMATTTSTQNSGLLDYLLPMFTEATGIDVEVIAVGTGKALQMGVDGEADVLLVHAKASEEAFVANGDGLERFDVMYNDFVIVGPESDPAKLGEVAPNDAAQALKAINEAEATFVSRGDDSGTHKKEKSLWVAADMQPEGEWYLEAGKGMGDVIQMANEMLAYTMSDRATYLSMSDQLELVVLTEGDSILFNQYGVIAVNPEKNELINAKGAQTFIEWILSEKAQNAIGTFGVEKFGDPLFIPNAK